MNPISLEAKLIAAAVLLVLGISGVILWDMHEQHRGAQKCEQADTKAAEQQIRDLQKQLAAYRTQLDEANDRHKDDEDLLAAAASKPVPHLVCHTAGSQPVQPVPTAAPGELATPGLPDAVHGSDFDPVPALRQLSVGYEGRVEEARDALRRWPK